jgi:hypothetical protein
MIFRTAHASLLSWCRILPAGPVEESVENIAGQLFLIRDPVAFGVRVRHSRADENFPAMEEPRVTVLLVAEAEHVRHPVMAEEPPVECSHALRRDERHFERALPLYLEDAEGTPHEPLDMSHNHPMSPLRIPHDHLCVLSAVCCVLVVSDGYAHTLR